MGDESGIMRIWVHGLFLSALVLAMQLCGSGTEMEAIETNCSPLSFHLWGDNTQIWQVEVVAGKSYQVSVEPVNLISVNNEVAIYIQDNERVGIAQALNARGDNVYLDFVAPDDSRVFVLVASRSAEGNGDLGEYTVKVCEE